MKKHSYIFIIFILFQFSCIAQQDSVVHVGKKIITLSEVVLSKKLNVQRFVNSIKNDSSFYKAFKNLRIIGYTSLNDIRMLDKENHIKASLSSKTNQMVKNNCRSMKVLEEKVTGDFYKNMRQYNYYTANMYASLFFTNGNVCGENNIVGNMEFDPGKKSGIDKHKEQLKILFFNPGKKIKGIPFLSGKTEIFDDNIAVNYDMNIDYDVYDNTNCYVFTQKVKEGQESDVVLDEMKTWFDENTMEVLARTYTLSYNAAFYNFKVDMEVQMTRFNGLTIPRLIRYNGNWKVVTKKPEKGIFTATLFDFVK